MTSEFTHQPHAVNSLACFPFHWQSTAASGVNTGYCFGSSLSIHYGPRLHIVQFNSNDFRFFWGFLV
jgi:hypothetical protein